MKDTIPSEQFINQIKEHKFIPFINIPISTTIFNFLQRKDETLAKRSEAFYNIYTKNTNNIRQTNLFEKYYGSRQKQA
tara:strand:+ start:78 stop:311 length:234 start_codon:yes stop_codon:yes gene_type:complete